MADTDLTQLTLHELKLQLDSGDISSLDTVQAFRMAWESDEKKEKSVNGYVEFFDDAEEEAKKADRVRGAGNGGILNGLPLAVKDNIQIKGKSATCASKILQGYTAPYSATVIDRLSSQGAIYLGRTNMDEFAMGSSCEYSCYGPTRNPIDRDRTAGGSSGGSAAVVAARQAPFALGSDTGGSVRLPASFCGVYGLKPSYGTLSRYGLVAFGSSLDQIGCLARSPEDIALILSAASGVDSRDHTSEDTDFSGCYPLKAGSLRGLKVGIPEELISDAIDPEIITVFEHFRDWMSSEGAEVSVVSLPVLDACVAMYYIIAPAEASSNLSRFDGVKYGYRNSDGTSLLEMYENTREEGFGAEVKRRILIGNYVLSSGYYDAYYKKAQQVRALLSAKINEALTSVDILLSPTSPTPAFRLGEKVNDPLAMYLTDICTTAANLTKIPSLSIPAGNTGTGLAAGVQISGKRYSELQLLEIAAAWHSSSHHSGSAS
ncbi:MAG: Asp-tRNA(Asn)/Glu-tRNA(Gln) amidotransferase subunit GatA [Spirochaetales bacterium]|nr:Asp-tRNA(Asn)/Glu-tRNA(Gln) amidotransferase subunit GatA [Spirochaetales bacterium]